MSWQIAHGDVCRYCQHDNCMGDGARAVRETDCIENHFILLSIFRESSKILGSGKPELQRNNGSGNGTAIRRPQGR